MRKPTSVENFGRILLNAIAVIVLTVNLFAGPLTVPSALRIGLLCLLFVFIYRGNEAARWLIATLFLILGLFSITMAVYFVRIELPYDNPNTLTALYGIVHIGAFFTFLLSKSLHQFFAYQEERIYLSRQGEWDSQFKNI